jgi:hypothetical protein
MARGEMRQRTKNELREELDIANRTIAELRGELDALKSQAFGSAADAPIAAIVGMDEKFEPFVEVTKPHQIPPFALDAIAAHLSRMALAASKKDVDITEQWLVNTDTRLRMLEQQVRNLADNQGLATKTSEDLLSLVRGLIDAREAGVFGDEEKGG